MALGVIIPIGLGLSMDAAAVSISNGLCLSKLKIHHALTMALAFGLAQGIMPTLGYLAGAAFASLISSIDHWLALILLVLIGGKMLWEARSTKAESQNELNAKTIFLQAIATSIDALAVGVSFAALGVNIYLAASVIAATTFICCMVAVYVGHFFGDALKSKAEILGGVILILIGIKIFVDHMF